MFCFRPHRARAWYTLGPSQHVQVPNCLCFPHLLPSFTVTSLILFWSPNVKKSGQTKNHDSKRRDRILRFLLRPEIGQFAAHFGAISLLTYTCMEKGGGEIRWGKFKKTREDGAPKFQISLPCHGRARPEKSLERKEKLPKKSGSMFSNIIWLTPSPIPIFYMYSAGCIAQPLLPGSCEMLWWLVGGGRGVACREDALHSHGRGHLLSFWSISVYHFPLKHHAIVGCVIAQAARPFLATGLLTFL